MEKPDSIIFDMDGTLWDGVGAYIESWKRGLKHCNISKDINKEEFLSMVGWEKRKVLERLLPEYDIDRQETIHDTVNSFLPQSITDVGGQLYDGVKEGLAQLSTKYKLFIVSNCPEGLIQLFMNWAGISNYIIDEVAHGINSMPKHHNIKLLLDKHNLKNAIYVGDTAGDSEQSEIAQVPFVFVSYGFGSTDKYAVKFDDFNAFTKHLMELE